MLLFFLDHQDILEVKEIIDNLISLKRRLLSGNVDNPYVEYERIEGRFETIKNRALAYNNSTLADSQRVFRDYFLLFCHLAKFKQCLLTKSYRQSWDELQDCISNALFVGRFTPMNRRLDVPDIIGLLEDYEKLYPYTLFSSAEFVVSESRCSICGKSMQSPSCPHRRGQLYSGEVAAEIVKKIRTLQAICLVENPADKKCVIESINGKALSFSMLDEFLGMGFPWLQRFSITKTIERKIDPDIKMTDRNSPCTCGSGIKFKKCCGRDPYYDHLHCMITPGDQVNLSMF